MTKQPSYMDIGHDGEPLDMRMYILDENRVPVHVCMEEWGKRFHRGNRTVKQETVGKYWVSTVFLGIDHGGHDGTPVLFETMVFNDNDDGGDQDMRRYTTWDEAQDGHRKTVEKYRE